MDIIAQAIIAGMVLASAIVAASLLVAAVITWIDIGYDEDFAERYAKVRGDRT